MDITVLLLYGHYCMTLQVDNMLRMCLLVFGGRLVIVCVVVPCSIIVCAVYSYLVSPTPILTLFWFNSAVIFVN